jgi:hypothetical protein
MAAENTAADDPNRLKHQLSQDSSRVLNVVSEKKRVLNALNATSS